MVNILNQAIKIVKLNFRNKKALFMMLIFPIIMIIILGAALSKAFDTKIDMKDIKVLYTYENKNNKSDQDVIQNFIKNVDEPDLKFVQEDDSEKGINKIKQAEYACYIVLKDNGNVQFYKNKQFDIQANLIEIKLSAFVERYNSLSQVARVNPTMVSKLAEDKNFEYTQSKPLQGDRKPQSTDYYAITIVTLIILYSSMSGLNSTQSEKTQKTRSRMLCSSAKKYQILVGSVLGSFIITVFQVACVIAFSIYVLNANWGAHIGLVSIILASEILMAVSIGIATAFIFENEATASTVINMIIPLISFMGGAYFPIETFGKTFLNIANFSPVRWINKSILQLIYDNNAGGAVTAVCINLGVAIIAITLAAVIFKKEGATA